MVTEDFDSSVGRPTTIRSARRRAPVDGDLGLAGGAAAAGGGKVQKRQLDRALEFKGLFGGQENNRNMGLDARHAAAAENAGGGQELHDLALVLGDHHQQSSRLNGHGAGII
jgi:hypothetical protein